MEVLSGNLQGDQFKCCSDGSDSSESFHSQNVKDECKNELNRFLVELNFYIRGERGEREGRKARRINIQEKKRGGKAEGGKIRRGDWGAQRGGEKNTK